MAKIPIKTVVEGGGNCFFARGEAGTARSEVAAARCEVGRKDVVCPLCGEVMHVSRENTVFFRIWRGLCVLFCTDADG